VCIVVTSTGTSMPRNMTVTWKGTCEILDDQATKDWFYPELAEAIMGGKGARAQAFEEFLDSPRRIILKVTPTQRIGYDGTKMGKATTEWMKSRAAKPADRQERS
jgi:general stress protein 26